MTVHGYAGRFDRTIIVGAGKAAGGRIAIAPGAYILPGDPGGPFGSDYEIKLFSGLSGKGKGDPRDWDLIGSTADGSLKLEQNQQGLYFEWEPCTLNAAAVATRDAVAEWRLNGACLGYPEWRESHIRADGVEVITRTYIGGLLITRYGCTPGTGCKIKGELGADDPGLWGTRHVLNARTLEAA